VRNESRARAHDHAACCQMRRGGRRGCPSGLPLPRLRISPQAGPPSSWVGRLTSPISHPTPALHTHPRSGAALHACMQLKNGATPVQGGKLHCCPCRPHGHCARAAELPPGAPVCCTGALFSLHLTSAPSRLRSPAVRALLWDSFFRSWISRFCLRNRPFSTSWGNGRETAAAAEAVCPSPAVSAQRLCARGASPCRALMARRTAYTSGLPWTAR
jgi:hypothetical protein